MESAWAAFRDAPSERTIDPLMHAYAPLAGRLLARMRISLPQHVSTDDLLQAGMVGLWQAIERFNPEQGTDFRAYAVKRIRGAIVDELRHIDHLSRTRRLQVKKVESTIAEWTEKRGIAPTEDEVAGSLGMTRDEVGAILGEAQAPLSLDDVIVRTVDGRSALLVDLLADAMAEEPDRRVETCDMFAHVCAMFRRLSVREQKILYLYYFEELRLAEIAELFEVTQARICQIHALAISRLRAMLSNSGISSETKPGGNHA